MSSSPSSTGVTKFLIGDLVWAKMKGFSPWPGKIVDASTANMKKPPGNVRYKHTQCVYFFGSNNFAWIQEDAIKPYHEFKEANCKLNKSHAFKEAIEKIEDYIKKGGETDEKLGDINSSNVDPDVTINDKLNNNEDKKMNDNADDSSSKTTKEKTVKEEKEKNSLTSTSSSSGQKDYSRTPFNKSKPKKTVNLKENSNNDEEDAPVSKKMKTLSSDENSTAQITSASSTSITKSPNKGGARNLISRTSQLLDSNSATNNENDLDVGTASAKSKTIRASTLKFGFIGLGLMGQRMLKNLLNSGHSVTIWNRTPSKCKDFIKFGAHKATTPADVVAAADITFSCIADPHAVKEIVFGNCGVLAEMRNGKGYVEMTTVDPDTSNDISEAIIARGGRYLEAPLIGSGKIQAEEGNLTSIVAGDKSLFDDCSSCFQAISKHAFYLGSQVGDASKMNLVMSMLLGNLIGSLAESMALADRTGLAQKDLLEILSLSPLNCQMLISKGKSMIDSSFATEMPLTHMQKDLRLALQLGEVYEHPLPITASTNEVFKHAKHLGYSEHDVAAVYIRSRF